MNRKLFIVVLLIVSFVNACSNVESTPDTSLPKSWIIFQDKKYIYEKSYTEDNITDYELQLTGEYTGEDDGTEKGLEIYKDLETDSIFVKTETNGLIQWLRYLKVN